MNRVYERPEANSKLAAGVQLFYRENVMIQLLSEVLPPSSENACSKRLEFRVITEKPFWTMMTLS
jgi:hypothetical protein